MKSIIIMLVAAAPAWADAIRHVPPGEAEEGAPLELVFQAPASTPTLTLHVRAAGEPQFRAVELVRRDDQRWVATVTAMPPGLEYYVDAGGAPAFASPEWPHAIAVHLSEEGERRMHDLVRSQNRHSRMHGSYEYVDFGKRTAADGTKFVDEYYRIDTDFSYRLMKYPLEDIRVGYTRLLGTTDQMCDASATCQAGFRVGGWFELGLAPVEGFRFDVRGYAMAVKTGLGYGGRAEVRLGSLDASHVALGAEGFQDVGAAGYFRLGWATVPLTPMAATVEVTNMPFKTSKNGVRFMYDIARDLGNGLKVGVRIGYAARDQLVAGITGGGGVTWDF